MVLVRRRFLDLGFNGIDSWSLAYTGKGDRFGGFPIGLLASEISRHPLILTIDRVRHCQGGFPQNYFAFAKDGVGDRGNALGFAKILV